MLSPVPSTRGLPTHLREQTATLKAVLSAPLGCKHPSHLAGPLPSHSCTLTAPELCPFPSHRATRVPQAVHGPHTTSKPKPQGPSRLCSATTFPCDLGQVPEPQGAAAGSGSRNPSRQAARNWTPPKHERKRAAQAQPHPPDRLRAAALAQQKGRGQIPPVVPGDARLPHTAGSARWAQLTPLHTVLPATFPSRGCFAPLRKQKKTNPSHYRCLPCGAGLGETKKHLW